MVVALAGFTLGAPVLASATTATPSYLFKASSQKKLVETARDHHWSLKFSKSSDDTLHVVALRVEFVKDTAAQTTGNGLFGLRGDPDEDAFYKNDTSYVYDTRPHDSLYFSRQLAAVKNYYAKISRGSLTLEYSVFPSGSDQAFTVDKPMPFYSPGGKKKKETYNEYYTRKTIGFMAFIRDALLSANKNSEQSPFANLHYVASDRTIRDDQNRKTVFLVFHAGSSFLTDGGTEGSLGQDTPSDMIDAFITPDHFKFYRDTLDIKDAGIMVEGKNGKLLIDEIMTCSETSNQDGLNWGIQGIIINQIARQLGIPDLFSTSNGVSSIGAFCIMDVAGYSAGKGFFAPYPSAWVRAFMGWDRAIAVSAGVKGTYSVKALTSVLDRDTLPVPLSDSDTTILLVPINDHEYYLIENRQRNLSGNSELFHYDTIDTYDSVVISGYPFVAEIDKCVLSSSGANQSNVIQRVVNNDVTLPASGILVWHVDEQIIRDRLKYNSVNADSTYRGVSLVEADGITDLGVIFRDFFYQATFDYGGAEDVFPHRTKVEKKDSVITVDGFGPYTLPTSKANDGGHSYMELTFAPANKEYGIERTALGKNDGYHFIENYADSIFTVSVNWNYTVPSWPKHAVPGRFFDPLLGEFDASSPGKELFLLDQSGRVYIWSSDPEGVRNYNTVPSPVNRVNFSNDTMHNADTAFFFDSLENAFVMPTLIGNRVFVPLKNNTIALFGNTIDTTGARHAVLNIGASPSTYVCNYRDSTWAVGCNGGNVVFGKAHDTIVTRQLSSTSPVTAIASLRNADAIAVVQSDRTLTILSSEEITPLAVTKKLPDKAISPFTLVTGNIDNSEDNGIEIVVTDSRMGIWVYHDDLTLAHGWIDDPSDFASYYSDTTSDRERLPQNTSAPALADIDRDGFLDIIVGGTNGLYAFNYKGALKSKWPAFLDRTYWYQRGSITSSPVVVTGDDKRPLVLFSSLTGDRPTYKFTKVTRADRSKGIVWFRQESGATDSIWGYTPKDIDTILTMYDSIVAPYVMPGGIIDAVNDQAKRPLQHIDKRLQSPWPLTTGSSLHTAPLIGYMDSDAIPDLISVATDGTVYRWELPSSILPDTLFWPQTGYDGGRSFSYGGSAVPALKTTKEPITLFSFPNPTTRDVEAVTFKYQFNAPASNVKLAIYSYTGNRVYSNATMGTPPYSLSGSFPDWNMLIVPIKQIPPGLYRCRLEATIGGKQHQHYWKLAIVK